MSSKLLNTINGGYARLFPGDEQETTTINFNGTLKVVKDSKLWHATVNAGGSLRVAGFVGSVEVQSNGILIIESGGNVGTASCWPGAKVTVSSGGIVQVMHDHGCDLVDNGFVKSRTYLKLC